MHAQASVGKSIFSFGGKRVKEQRILGSFSTMAESNSIERWMSSETVTNFPCRLDDLPTPALIVDEDVVRRNCTQMSAKAAKAGVMLRPHVKVNAMTMHCGRIL
jgi:hypothetical protein